MSNSKARQERMLEEVLRQPGNNRCADCRSPAPRWASINLGVFLCVQCASVHRKLGTHNSRVKSVTMDDWSKEMIETMRNMGNSKANSIYNPDESRNPPPTNTSEFNDRDGELEKFIRRKYVEGRFKQSTRGASGYEDSRPRASSIRTNMTGTSSTGSFQRQSPNPELNDIVVPRTRTPVTGAEDNRPPIFGTRSNGPRDSPARPRPRPTHSATLEIPVLSREESASYALPLSTSSSSLGQGASQSHLTPRGKGATKSMVQDNWNDLLQASSADDSQTGPGGRRSPNPFARSMSGGGRSPRPESQLAPPLAGQYQAQKEQQASGAAFGDLLAIGGGSGSGSTMSNNSVQSGSTPSFGMQQQYQQQQQPQAMQQNYAGYSQQQQPQQQSNYGNGMMANTMGNPFTQNGGMMNGGNGYYASTPTNGMGMGMNPGMSMQLPNNQMQVGNGMQMNMNTNMGMSMGMGSSSPFPLAATSPYSSLSNGNGGYFPQQQQQQQMQPPMQQQQQFQQQGYGQTQGQGQQVPMGMGMGMGGGMMMPSNWGSGQR